METTTRRSEMASTEPNIDAAITVSIDPNDAYGIIEAVGGHRDERGQYVFPDDYATWVLSEATEYAIRALPTLVFDAM
jgi:hypothetical protein